MAQNRPENRKSKPKTCVFFRRPGWLSIPQKRGLTNWQSVSRELVAALASREIREPTHEAKEEVPEEMACSASIRIGTFHCGMWIFRILCSSPLFYCVGT